MSSGRAARFSCAHMLVGLALCVGIGERTLAASTPAPSEGRSLGRRLVDRLDAVFVARCIGPGVDRVFQDLRATGALQRVLGERFALQRGDVRRNAIELEIQDGAGHPYAVTLGLPGSRDETPDGHGQRFAFYLEHSTSPRTPEVTGVLLAIAALFDEAIPETMLVRCPGATEAERGGNKRYPRWIILTSAALEVTIVLVGILLGLRAIPERRE